MESKLSRSAHRTTLSDPDDSRPVGNRGSAVSFEAHPGSSPVLPLDSARIGMVASVMVVAGGLYWISATGLLTASALRSFPPMAWGMALMLVLAVTGVILWGMRSTRPQVTARYVGGESNVRIPTTYDSITGLPTERLFMSLLNQALPRAHKHGRQVALLLVEMDHFTLSTELQGQVNINLIYRVQAARVKSALRSTDTVARLAERTFVVLLDQIASQDEVIAIATKMQATVSLPFTVEGHEVFLTSRIGISLASPDGADGPALVRSAIEAVGKARAEGHAMYGFQGNVTAIQPSSPVLSSSSRDR